MISTYVFVTERNGELHMTAWPANFLFANRVPSEPSQAILLGFENDRNEFEVLQENGRALVQLMEEYPSIKSLDRTTFRITSQSEMLLFRMNWDR